MQNVVVEDSPFLAKEFHIGFVHNSRRTLILVGRKVEIKDIYL